MHNYERIIYNKISGLPVINDHFPWLVVLHTMLSYYLYDDGILWRYRIP